MRTINFLYIFGLGFQLTACNNPTSNSSNFKAKVTPSVVFAQPAAADSNNYKASNNQTSLAEVSTNISSSSPEVTSVNKPSKTPLNTKALPTCNASIYLKPSDMQDSKKFVVCINSALIATSTATATAAAIAVTPIEVESGKFSTVGSLEFARSSHSANLLNNGHVLIAGGFNGIDSLDSAELYNPSTGNFETVGNMVHGRYAHKTVDLKSGNILFIGGYAGYNETRRTLNSIELFDVKTNSFQVVGSMKHGRGGHQATLLMDGRVLITAGENDSVLASAEIFDPQTNTTIDIGSLTYARTDHTATLLANGDVLIVGGIDRVRPQYIEVFDHLTLTFKALNTKMDKFIHNTQLLANGKVLISGGYDGVLSLKTAAIFDPATQTLSEIEDMTHIRDSHSVTELQNHLVLISGGARNGYTTDTSEMFDPNTNTFVSAPIMNDLRDTHTATLLQNGDVLIVGGCTNLHTYLKSAELYRPE